MARPLGIEYPGAFYHVTSSSYQSFIADKGEEILTGDLIWWMISKDKRLGPRRYRSFVERGLDGELENPLKKVYAGSVLGGKSFIRELLDKLKEEVYSRVDVSHRKELQTPYETEEIVRLVSEHFGMNSEELLRQKGDGRNLIIHLLKNKTGMTNREIGEMAGGLSYSGVSRVEERFGEKLKKDKGLSKDLKAIINKLSNIKG